jgi:regulator of sigma E protease
VASLTTLLSFIFVLGVLIFVHELGHFLMARRIGVRVLTFSLGFGPKILSFKRGDTEYCVSAIPLGGYVKMAGENPEDSRTGAPDEFLSKSKWQRFQVLVMGPIMNLALALVVMTFVLYQGAAVAAVQEQPVVVGSVVADYPAAQAGIKVGDRIISIGGEEVPTWKQLDVAVATKANRTVPVLLMRDGRTMTVDVTPKAVSKYEIGDIGVLPILRPEIATVNPGEPAAEAGLQPGDVVLAAGGVRDVAYKPLLEMIKAHDGKPLPLEIKRGDQVLQITVTPRKNGDVARMGAQIYEVERKLINPTFPEAIKLSALQNWEWASMIVKTLGGLLIGDTPVKQLMGPIGIADLSGTAARAPGWIPLFQLMAMISLNLGLLNLMPVPVLDGGHIAILALEGLSRRDFSMKVKEKMLLAGFVLLVTLMVTVIYNDLTRVEWIEKLMPWR